MACLVASAIACGGSPPKANDASDADLAEDRDEPGASGQAQASSQQVQRGIDALQAGDAAQAVAILEKAREADPKDAQAAFYLAVAYEQSNEKQKALDLYREALNLDPKLTEAYVNLSFALLDGGEPAEAANVAARGLEVSPASPDLLTNRALALEAAGNEKEALTAYGKAVGASKDNAELRYAYALLLAKSDQTDAAKKQLAEVGRLSKDARVLAAAADLFAQLKDFDQCVQLFGQAIEAEESAVLYVRRGVCEHGRKQDSAALADYTKALQLDPEAPQAHYYLGLQHKQAGDKKKACEHLAKAAAGEGQYAKAAAKQGASMGCK
jgi:Tfp pilus assembly protein PilF